MATDLLESLRRHSAAWGKDLELVQGAGGNTSVKIDGILHVKASGNSLAAAERARVFVPIPLPDALAMADGAAAPMIDGGLRPSIETSLHALMPQRVVAHLHMVNAIAYGVRADAEKALGVALRGVNWAWVPYAKPGVPLANAVRAAVRGRPVEVVLLGNHGIIFCGDSCEAIDRLIGTVRDRLAAKQRLGKSDLTSLRAIGERLGLEPARHPEAHLAAAHPTSLAFATAGSLYPDHPVFLGRGARVQRADQGPDPAPQTLLHLVPGVGALLACGLPDAAHEMAACLGLVVSRIPDGAPLRPLSRQQEDELLNWEAEIYRRNLTTN